MPPQGKFSAADVGQFKPEDVDQAPPPSTEKPKKGLFGTIGTLGEIAYGLTTGGRKWGDDANMVQRNLPSIGGAVGGAIGGAGGTAFGFGVGGVPGAVGGATLGGATGESVNQVIDAGRSMIGLPTANAAPPPMTVTEATRRMGTQGAVQGGTELIGGQVGRAIAYGARRAAPILMRSAMKPGIDYAVDTNAQNVPKVVQTMLDEGMTMTRGGIKKLYNLLGTVGKTIETKTATAPGSVYPELVVDHALNQTKQLAEQVTSAQDLKIIADTANQFLDEQIAKQGLKLRPGQHGYIEELQAALAKRGQLMRPASPLTVTQAQAAKTATYKSLGDKAFDASTTATSVDAQKGLASGLREQIEQLVPGIKADNARWGALTESLDVAARRMSVAGNRDLGGIFWIAHNPAAFLAAKFDQSPAVKSLIAKGLWEQAGKLAKVPPQLLRFAVMALASEPESMEPMASHERNR